MLKVAFGVNIPQAFKVSLLNLADPRIGREPYFNNWSFEL